MEAWNNGYQGSEVQGLEVEFKVGLGLYNPRGYAYRLLCFC